MSVFVVCFAVNEAGFEEANGRRLTDILVAVTSRTQVIVVCRSVNIRFMSGSKHGPPIHSQYHWRLQREAGGLAPSLFGTGKV